MERMDVEAVACLTREAGETGVHTGELDRHVGELDCPTREEVGQEREGVEVAGERQLLLALERAEDGAQCADVFAHACNRPGEFRREAPNDVRLHLSAQAELEVSAGLVREVPRNLRGHHRAPWERHRDRGSDAECGRGVGGDRAREERVVVRLGEPHRRELESLGAAGQ